ncbi:hypothetical protein PVAND_006722 [Polypedilum vanderplanki]|uniref:Palmitoleoyl-protein carboxylesterase NOTUM n=1 Tax=Polypedilum vanderplanki TaxID=319348 RepID=A0A9J6C4V2_POLVA|nr:hypothetical protein PVAND_006722 [Polypedilum vanderplanki]
MKSFKIILIIFALTLHYIPCDCRSFSTNFTSVNNVNNTSRTARQNKGGDFESNSIQWIVGKTEMNSSNGYSNKSTKLKRVFLSNRDITCNDGSQAGFYLRKSPGSRRWVVFFEGGWHCYDHKSCKMRWTKMRHLMTSTTWPETRDVGGILSPLQSENPYWFNANHVFVPYCSSDSWSGNRSKPETRDSFRFMGSLIVRQVIADLIPLGLGNAQGTDLLMAGSSAGGLGVMLNMDKIRAFLQDERGLNVHVRGVSDSGWFLDREPFLPGTIAGAEAVRQGWKLWNGVLPEDCVAEQKEPWRCYFGHRLYNTLKSPLFIFQWLFDEAQMRADNVGAPVTPQQWDYIHEMGGALRKSLENVTAVFAPSCIGHSVLTKRDWQNIKIDDVSLTDSLRCWENSLLKDRKITLKLSENKRLNKHKKHKGRNHQSDQPHLTNEEREQRRRERRREQRMKLTPEEREQRRLERRERRRQERLLQKMEAKNQPPRAQRSPQENEMNDKNSLPKIIENEPVAKQQQKKRRQQFNQRRRMQQIESQNATRLPKHRRQNHKQHNLNTKGPNKRRHGEHNRQKLLKAQNQLIEIKEPKKCGMKLLERCSWPQCNHSCPSLTNPLTGEEMKFLELLTSFGLDIDAVAQALGVDLHTLNNMDHKELIKLFTESTS